MLGEKDWAASGKVEVEGTAPHRKGQTCHAQDVTISSVQQESDGVW